MKKRILLALGLVICCVFSNYAASRKKDEHIKNNNYDVIKENKTDVSSNTSSTSAKQNNEYVDLGLPSGTLWATYNVGATKPEEYGYYFAWGETKSSESYDRSTYKFYDSNSQTCTKYTPNNDFRVLDSSDDVAAVNWGTDWRMPTIDEMRELVNNCQFIWTELNGVKGAKFASSNGNSIFLPAAGYSIGSGVSGVESFSYYWSASIRVGNENYAQYLNFDSYKAECDNIDRFLGFPVRPVRSEHETAAMIDD